MADGGNIIAGRKLTASAAGSRGESVRGGKRADVDDGDNVDEEQHDVGGGEEGDDETADEEWEDIEEDDAVGEGVEIVIPGKLRTMAAEVKYGEIEKCIDHRCVLRVWI